jgi:hypothetical protein
MPRAFPGLPRWLYISSLPSHLPRPRCIMWNVPKVAVPNCCDGLFATIRSGHSHTNRPLQIAEPIDANNQSVTEEQR